MNSETNQPKKRGRPARGESRAETGRPKRIPISGSRLRMNVPEEVKDPNFFYYWFNDVNNDIYRAKQAGYVHVLQSEVGNSIGEKDVDSAQSESSVVSMRVGQGVTAYLMKQPMEYRKEDMDAYHAEIDKSEAALKQKLNSGQDGQYGKVTIN